MSPAHGCGGARATIEFNNSPSAKKSGEARKQAGKKEGGLGEGIFARLPKRSPAALLVQSRTQQKSFLFLLEEKIRRAQNEKSKEYFSVVWRVERAVAGLASLVWFRSAVFDKMSSSQTVKTHHPQNTPPRRGALIMWSYFSICANLF